MIKKGFTLAELEELNDTRYEQVEAYGGVVDIASLCSEDMIEWLEANDDPEKRKEAGLRLLVKSIGTATRDENGNVIKFEHVPAERQDEVRAKFRRKDAVNNGKVIKAILKLNGLGKDGDNKVEQKVGELKNDSGEAMPDASPTDSPSQ